MTDLSSKELNSLKDEVFDDKSFLERVFSAFKKALGIVDYSDLHVDIPSFCEGCDKSQKHSMRFIPMWKVCKMLSEIKKASINGITLTSTEQAKIARRCLLDPKEASRSQEAKSC